MIQKQGRGVIGDQFQRLDNLYAQNSPMKKIKRITRTSNKTKCLNNKRGLW